MNPNSESRDPATGLDSAPSALCDLEQAIKFLEACLLPSEIDELGSTNELIFSIFQIYVVIQIPKYVRVTSYQLLSFLLFLQLAKNQVYLLQSWLATPFMLTLLICLKGHVQTNYPDLND